MNEPNTNYIAEYETDKAIIKVRFSDTSNLTREEVFKGIAQTAYNLCLHEYKRKLKENENE